MACGNCTVRVILIVLNTLFMLLSLAMLGVGIVVIVTSEEFFRLLLQASAQLPDDKVKEVIRELSQQSGIVRAGGIVLTSLGGIVLLLAFLGCFGALRESKCLLAMYSAFIGVFATVKIAAVVVLLTNLSAFSDLTGRSLSGLKDQFVSINDVAGASPGDAAATYFVNILQVTLDCCGVVEVDDVANSSSWLNSNRSWTDGQRMQIPATCCTVQPSRKAALLASLDWDSIGDFLQDPQCPVTLETKHNNACIDALSNELRRFLWPTVATVAGFVFLEVLLILLSIITLCTARTEKIGNPYY